MHITFYKYQGTGNDFVMIDNRNLSFPKETRIIEHLCDRRFGIGADGLILLENHPTENFRMVYFNSDGNESSMCGNGGRCLVAFAKQLGVIENKASFEAVDGMHHATVSATGIVSLQMKDVTAVDQYEGHIFLNTGSPHHVEIVDDLKGLDVKGYGASIRYGALYGAAGSNINFVNQIGDAIFAVRTYERGVEDETFSCGTGVTAVAIAMKATGKTDANLIQLETPGGTLEVAFEHEGTTFTQVFLKGPAKFVFEGTITI